MEEKSIIERIRNGEKSLIDQFYFDNKILISYSIERHKDLDLDTATDLYQNAFSIFIEKITSGEITQIGLVQQGLLSIFMGDLYERLIQERNIKAFSQPVAFRIETLSSKEMLLGQIREMIVTDKIRIQYYKSERNVDFVNLQIIIPDNAKYDTLSEIIKILSDFRRTYKKELFFDALIKGSIIIQIKCPHWLVALIIKAIELFLMHDGVEINVVSDPSTVVNMSDLKKMTIGFCELLFDDIKLAIKIQPSQFILYVFFLNHREGIHLKDIPSNHKKFFISIFEKLNYEGYCQTSSGKEKDSILNRYLSQENVNSRRSKINKLLSEKLTRYKFAPDAIPNYLITGIKGGIYKVGIGENPEYIDLGEFAMSKT